MDRKYLSEEKKLKLKKDYKSAIQQATRAQKEEELEECFQKSLLYFQYGLFRKALRLLKVLSGKGYAKAQYAIGWIYDDGLGVFLNNRKAQKWYKTALENNSIEAQLAIAYDYRHGYGVEQDIVKAVDISKSAAQSGNATALFNLGYIYWEGIGRTKNVKMATEYLQKAANLYYPTALAILLVIWYRKKDVKNILDLCRIDIAPTYIDLLCHRIQMADVEKVNELLKFILTITEKEGTSVVEVLHSNVVNSLLDEVINEKKLQEKAPGPLIRLSLIKAHVYLFLRYRTKYLAEFFCPKAWIVWTGTFGDCDIKIWKEKYNIVNNECLKLFKEWLKSIELQTPQYYSSKNMCVEPWRFSKYSFEYNEHYRISPLISVSLMLVICGLGFSVGFYLLDNTSTYWPAWIIGILNFIVMILMFVVFFLTIYLGLNIPGHIDNFKLILSSERIIPKKILRRRLWEYVKNYIFKYPDTITRIQEKKSEPIFADKRQGYTGGLRSDI